MNLFHSCFHKQGFWIRLGKWSDNYVGRGIHVSWAKPLFSVRNGYTKHWKIGPARITFLPEIIYKESK